MVNCCIDVDKAACLEQYPYNCCTLVMIFVRTVVVGLADVHVIVIHSSGIPALYTHQRREDILQ